MVLRCAAELDPYRTCTATKGNRHSCITGRIWWLAMAVRTFCLKKDTSHRSLLLLSTDSA